MNRDLGPIVCALISAGGDPRSHELWPAWVVLWERENGRSPTVFDLYESATCPCCF